MLRFFILNVLMLGFVSLVAQPVLVNNIDELHKADKNALPGSVIILRDGNWSDVTIKLESKGTKEKPITFKAQTAGKVIIQGKSRLALGGDHIIVDGLYFRNGYAADRAVIEYRANKDQLANNCRITNCVIDAFNNPKRMDENNWVLFYGKNNRLDHCSFTDKKNMGVLLAVILDDDKSRENFHSIDHNYFGKRIPLASNGGEIIRVGVSQHCQFNSNTQIIDNFFEHCDGETEIVSIKSGSNVVKNNLFKECQGGVVLRHGDNNTVENNIFLGNNKPGTGGVRVINKGQWVINNFFYQCRGVDFRSPLSIMNGIPNSPANRYVQVTDAVIANNTWMECSPISFCEGSDAERTLPPDNVLFMNNVFYNTVDSTLYHVFDDTKGIRFRGNQVNQSYKFKSPKRLDAVFIPGMMQLEKNGTVQLPRSQIKGAVTLPDSIAKISQQRTGRILSTIPGFSDMALLKKIETNAYAASGAGWHNRKNGSVKNGILKVKCGSTEAINNVLAKKSPAEIYLTATSYEINEPLIIGSDITITGPQKTKIKIKSPANPAVFIITGNGNLRIQGINVDGSGVRSKHFIASDEYGYSGHYNISISFSSLSNFSRKNGCEDLFFGNKSMVADSVIISHSTFENNETNGFMMTEEKDNKGYYNAEKIIINNNSFIDHKGQLINIYRGGNDESTLGPQLFFNINHVTNGNSGTNEPLILFTGVQVTQVVWNKFSNCNPGGTLVKYVDIVRARHYFSGNEIENSGSIEKNQFFTEKNNSIK